MSSDWPVASALMAGRYRLVSLLETGGMAEIWRAEDELLDRPVAVKLPTSPQVVWREARMAARLSHPGIAAVHDYREAVRPDGTVVPFVVMELLTGESVAARVDRELIGWAEAARIGAAVADALAAAHANGVVHRDIKPGNVMLTPNGVKILDFGISVAAGEPDDDDTGATFGTPAYVAPERLDGMPAEPATDVYGLGVLLFEMVTGDPPYPVETWEELAAARAGGPSALPDFLPADFRDVVTRCLDADPAHRPTAARLRADLLAVALRSRPPAPKPASAGDRPAAAATGPSTANAVAEPSVAALTPGVPAAAAAAAHSVTPATAHSVAPGAAHSATPAAARSGTPGATAGSLAAARSVPPAASDGGEQPAASGAIGEMVRAAGRPVDQPGSTAEAARPAAVPSPATDSGRPASDSGSPARPVAGDAPPSVGGIPRPRRNTPDTAFAAGAEAGSVREQRNRAAFAYTDGGEARDWRPEGGSRRAPTGPNGSPRPTGTRNFATGRAAAATLDMGQSPSRRTAFGIGAAVVLAALIGAFAVLAWTHRDNNRTEAVPPPAPATPTTSATVTTASPTPANASPTPARPSATASLTFAEAVSRMRAAVEGGAANRQIRPDVAQDLLNLLGPLSNAQGTDVTSQIRALRQKIQTRVGEGGVSQARAAVLQSRLKDLDRAAGT